MPDTTIVLTHVYEQLPRNNRSSLKLDYKYKKFKFSGKVEDEW